MFSLKNMPYIMYSFVPSLKYCKHGPQKYFELSIFTKSSNVKSTKQRAIKICFLLIPLSFTG